MRLQAATIKDNFGHEHVLPGPFASLSEIRGRNTGHWFSKDTMKSFGTTFPDGGNIRAGRLFLSSDLSYEGTHAVSVRVADDTGAISTAVDRDGVELHNLTLSQARAAVSELLYTRPIEATGLDGYLDSVEGTPEGGQQHLGAKLAQLQEQVPEVEEIEDGGLEL